MYYFHGQLSAMQQVIIAMLIAITSLIALYGLNVWALTLISVLGRRRLPAAPRISDWPKVSVHLPLYNEKRVVKRLLEACINLEYPRDKLAIIVVDDSTDETTSIAESFQRLYPDLVKVIHRSRRDGFKAGALKVAFENSDGEFIALFDADYVPPRDFLKRMIPYMYIDDRIGFAQARWSYLDGEFSWIARAISLAIDVWAFVDQRARYVANLLAHFSGTCGVFRRKSIEDAGGWSPNSLAEDLDLSIRLYLKGWKYIYVPSVVCPGEIPPTFETLKKQQYRWARGFSECLRKYWLTIIRCRRLSLFQKMEALLHLGTYFMCPLTIVGIVIALLYYLVLPSSYWLFEFWKYKPALLTFGLSLIIYTAPLVASGVTLWQLAKETAARFSRLLHLAYLGVLVYALLLNNTKAVLEGLMSRSSFFHRTPKVGLADASGRGLEEIIKDLRD